MTITLDGERPISWNIFNARAHWSRRKEENDRVHKLVQYSVLNIAVHAQLSRKDLLFADAVDITISSYFKNRPLDPDNICAKLYIDALKGLVIQDDNPKFVRSVTTRSLVDKENPRVEIVVEEVRE